ncbi:MAG: hypothetical protein AAF734_07905 [Bacteroidota bacterium]
MKYFFGIIWIFLGWLSACTDASDTTESSSTEDSLKTEIDSLGNEITLLTDDSLLTPALAPTKIEQERFTLTFPNPPERTVDSTDGTVIYLYANEADTERYILLYRDFTDEEIAQETSTSFLEKAIAGILSDFEENEIGKKEEITLQGHQGVDMLIGSPEKSYYAWRIFFVNKRLYQILIVKNITFPSQKEITRFMGSFEFSEPL